MENREATDDILIADAQRGELREFNDLVIRYQSAIYNYSLRMMGEEASAADITQDTFIKAYRALNSFRGGNFKAWLFRIASNLCYDELRRTSRKPQSSLEELQHEDSPDAAELPSNTETPEETVQRSELMRAIQHCISLLNPAQRTVLLLCDIQGYSYLQAAEISSIQVGTVKSRLSRARLSMRNCLRAIPELLPDKYRLKL